tara:strand:+ start:14881 stop:15408 length:528 start_codon:yes stop_codon:yes gene_type:complete
MELGQYITDLQRQLADVAENGSDETRVVAERLVTKLDSAARLVLLDVLSAAAGEITRDLAPSSVDVRLRGREVDFVVSHASTEDDEGRGITAAAIDFDDASTSRTTLRLPDALKLRVDEAAAIDGVSVNTWLVRAIAAAAQPSHQTPPQPSGHPQRPKSPQRNSALGDSFAGWAR